MAHLYTDVHKTTYCEETKTWKGPNFPLMYHKDVSVGRVILHALDRADSKIIQIHHDENTQLTGKMLKTYTIRCAIQLKLRGIGMGDCIGIIARNSSYIGSVLFAGLTIGAPINALDVAFSCDDITHMFGLTNPKIIFCDADIIDLLKEALMRLGADIPIVSVGTRVDEYPFLEDLLVEVDGENTFIPPELENGANHPALFVCSSGTTGLPKGVTLSHAHILHRTSNSFRLKMNDMYFSMSSLYWLTGSGIAIQGTITGVTRILSTQTFTPELFFEVVQKYKVSAALLPPSFIGQIVQSNEIESIDLSSIRIIFVTGSLLRSTFHENMDKMLPNGNVASAYAMTEAGGVVSSSFSVDKPESVGELLHDTEIKLLNENYENVGPNVRGEICIKSKFIFMGYHNNPDATRETIDNENWIHTGDIGYFDNDGILYVVDRLKEILKYRNYQISPSELEAIIMKIEDIHMAVVIGIPDPVCNDLPAAVVIRKSPHITAEYIYKYVAEHVTDYKRLRGGVYFVNKFPLAPSGKILKRKVREYAINEHNKTLNSEDTFIRQLANLTFDKQIQE